MNTDTALTDPDTPGRARAITALVWVVLAGAFAASSAALMAATAATGTWSWLAWTGPVVVDGVIVVFAQVAMSMRRRGETLRTIACWLVVAASTTLSAALNVAHAADYGTTGWVGLGGRVLAAYLPLMVLMAGEAQSWLTVESPKRAAARAALEADRAAAAAVEDARRAAATEAAIATAVAKVRAEADIELAKLRTQEPAVEHTARHVITDTPAVEVTAPAVAAAPVTPPALTPAPAAVEARTGNDTREQVLTLAAQGLTPGAISRELGGTPSRPTIARWIKEHQDAAPVAA